MSWRTIPVSLTELCLDTTLRCGQSFRWRQSPDGVWSCALQGRLLSLRQDASHLYYRVQWPGKKNDAKPVKKAAKTSTSTSSSASKSPLTPPSSIRGNGAADDGNGDDDDTEAFIRHYLNLSHDLAALYAQWSAADANFAAKAPRFTGVRILRQDAWEALVGFICSSNNNIARISQMMEKLCENYGALIGRAPGPAIPATAGGDGEGGGGGGGGGGGTERNYYDMPTAHALSDAAVEAHLRELGFGYRAKYLQRTAAMIVAAEEEKEEAEQKTKGKKGAKKEQKDGTAIGAGRSWLDSLRNPEAPAFGSGLAPSDAGEMSESGGREGYRAAHTALLALQGVGPKVADCVCLMGLGWGEAVPVDTHVWQIAVRDYRFGRGGGGGKQASLTRATYDAVADRFRALWGKEAGWAHSVLFTADLRAFADRLRAKIEVTEDVVATADEVVVKTEQTVKAEVVEPPEVLGRGQRGRKAIKREAKDEDEDEEKENRNGSAKAAATVIEQKTTVRTTRAKRRKTG